MAAVARLSPPFAVTNSFSSLLAIRATLPNRRNPNCSARGTSCPAVCPDSSTVVSTSSFCRRDLLLSGLSTFILPVSDVHAMVELDDDVKMEVLTDDINAYSFLYPIKLQAKNFAFKWVESRKPERYSSAAPLSPDARQRIVSERVDMINNLVISVSIGPPNSRFLTSNDTSSWNAKDVANSVLADKSSLRITTGQRMAESSVLDSHSVIVNEQPYWYYEYLVRKSPTKSAPEPNLFRHNVASTAERDGYLYSLNASTLSKQWENLGPVLQKTVESFRLLPPTENYVPPFKDPWRFW
ncbi:psbP domain-containing protein 5, chloroplastic-like [Zingiber officinale]|uniref:psbP domain-containing protein 5, chloroplastic-like n=1 Tax=Zingiber officinale TaxID=94328 RepID=UPI001C4B2483|nr:psbP domain-containing protein 5, chloroplastic-like [Zingiber officinale]XP_042458401.1 psbP domain-containing protein 5, chloroplastic-like [Zingiber officinale]XP_042458402.1 psbP domain-containing protein 5, chloroplastic-like [Zingiber officinale]